MQGRHFEICKLGGSESAIESRFESVHLFAWSKLCAKFGTFIRSGNENSILTCQQTLLYGSQFGDTHQPFEDL